MALIRRLSGREKAVRFGIALLAVVLLAGLSLGSARLIKREYNRKMAPVFAEMFPKKKVPGKPGKKPAVGRKQDLKTDVSNGRFDIWKSGLEVWKTSPVYGTGYTSFVPYTKECKPSQQFYEYIGLSGDYWDRAACGHCRAHHPVCAEAGISFGRRRLSGYGGDALLCRRCRCVYDVPSGRDVHKLSRRLCALVVLWVYGAVRVPGAERVLML